MPVDARTLIEPAVPEAGVHPHNQIVLFSVPKEITQIEAKGSIAVVVTADEISVQKHQRAAEGAVEFDNNPPAGIPFRDVEGATIPADAGLGIPPAQRLETVAFLIGIAHERQLDRPVMRQTQVAPL